MARAASSATGAPSSAPTVSTRLDEPYEPKVPHFPSIEEVTEFLDVFRIPDLTPFPSEGSPVAPWYDVGDGRTHGIPNGWLKQEDLDHDVSPWVEVACQIASGVVASWVALRTKQSTTFNAYWEWGAGGNRGFSERLLDRLHLNWVQTGTGAWVRVPFPWIGNVAQDPLLTVVSEREETHPLWILRQRLLPKGGSGLAVLAGLEESDVTLAFPLDRRQSGTSSLLVGQPAQLSDGLRTELGTMADDLRTFLDTLEPPEEWTTESVLKSAVSSINPLAAILAFGIPGSRDSVVQALRYLPYYIDEMATPDATLADVAAHALEAAGSIRVDGTLKDILGTIEFFYDTFKKKGAKEDLVPRLDGLQFMLGLDEAQRDELIAGLRGEEMTPAVALPPVRQTYARGISLFTEDRADPEPDPDWSHFQKIYYRQRVAYRKATSPTVDAACIFDLTGRLVEGLIQVDDELQAINGLATGDGIIASRLRGLLRERGLTRLSDALDGVSVASVARFVVRQLLIDNFRQFFGRERTFDRDELLDALLWRRAEDYVSLTEEVLGPVVRVPPFELDHRQIWMEYVATRMTPMSTFWTRGAFVDPDEDVDPGALGRILQAIAFIPMTAEFAVDINAALDSCDVAKVREWLRLARASGPEEAPLLYYGDPGSDLPEPELDPEPIPGPATRLEPL